MDYSTHIPVKYTEPVRITDTYFKTLHQNLFFVLFLVFEHTDLGAKFIAHPLIKDEKYKNNTASHLLHHCKRNVL
jgi:hypothetical protein